MRIFLPRKALALGLLSAMAWHAGGASAQPVTHPFSSRPIAGHYIVVFKKDVANPAAEAAAIVRGANGRLTHVYSSAIKGFAATLPPAAVQALRGNPAVDYLEQDQVVSLNEAQYEATWGLDRIDQADRPLDSVYQYSATGAGVTAFIIDTGIRADHVEFTGRVLPGYSAITDGNGTNDCNGHGTHVAATSGGTTWGVAKQVGLVPVRVLDCAGSGSYSGVIAGVDWVAASGLRPAAANMSLGGGFSASLNAAVAGAVAQGVTMVVAAGNSSADACGYSPASESSALTVGATTSLDARASYSNYGSCLDIFAPGSSITSAWYTSSTATNTISGTSMAAPHVTGVAALVLQANPTASPAAVASFLVANATSNRISSPGTGSPNLLLYSFANGTAVEPALPVVAVKSLTGGTSRAGKGWKANATVTLHDVNSKAAVPNATVTGSFAPGASGSCVTGTTGSCTLWSGSLATATTSTVFSVTDVSGRLSYDAAQNSATRITISKP